MVIRVPSFPSSSLMSSPKFLMSYCRQLSCHSHRTGRLLTLFAFWCRKKKDHKNRDRMAKSPSSGYISSLSLSGKLSETRVEREECELLTSFTRVQIKEESFVWKKEAERRGYYTFFMQFKQQEWSLLIFFSRCNQRRTPGDPLTSLCTNSFKGSLCISNESMKRREPLTVSRVSLETTMDVTQVQDPYEWTMNVS